ncbi:MAG: flippase-like domain-containing protein [Magnetococcales bacterium]|nr:flippase-like domain-containing protein [Magnetococcales bacterium]
MIPVVILAAIVSQMQWQQLRTLLGQAEYHLIMVAFVLQLAPIFLQGWRWQVLLKSDANPWPWAWVQFIHLEAGFFDAFVPGRVGSDIYRLALIPAGLRHHAAASLLLMRLQGLVINFAAFVIAALFWFGADVQQHKTLFGLVGITTLIGGVVGVVLVKTGFPFLPWMLRHPGVVGKLAGHVSKVMVALRVGGRNLRILWVSTCIDIGFVLWSSLIFLLVGRAFGMEIPWSLFMVGSPAIMVTALLPISIQGRGPAELVALYFWHKIGGASTEQVVLVSLGVLAINMLHCLLAGLLVLWRARQLPLPKLPAGMTKS